MKIAMAQINATVGDLEANVKKIRENMKKANQYNVDLALFPELVITGYPPQDLLFDKDFIYRNKELVNNIVSARISLNKESLKSQS